MVACPLLDGLLASIGALWLKSDELPSTTARAAERAPGAAVLYPGHNLLRHQQRRPRPKEGDYLSVSSITTSVDCRERINAPPSEACVRHT